MHSGSRLLAVLILYLSCMFLGLRLTASSFAVYGEEASTAKSGTSLNRVSVYVYDAPIFNNTDLIECYRKTTGVVPWLHEDWDVAENVGEIWMHRALLDHPWRVLDPDDADVFFVPVYPFLSFHLLERLRGKNKCPRKNHWKRMDAITSFLTMKSTHFKRFGGADHIIICTWWKCLESINTYYRMFLRRMILGMHEIVDYWADWGCFGKEMTVPYVASSSITTSEVIRGLSDEERTVPFFFAGTARRRLERLNLEVVGELVPESLIELSTDEFTWIEDSASYGHHMTRSRFCFCPRGDTLSSRRLFDAIAAGCIPIITEDIVHVLPYIRTDLNYSDFTVIAPIGTFRTRGRVAALVRDLFTRSEEELRPILKGLNEARASLLYGITNGPNWGDMKPFEGTVTRFLLEANMRSSQRRWECVPQEFYKRSPALLKWAHPTVPCNKTWAGFPPPPETKELWLINSEAIAIKEYSLLFCVPPNTGSLQFRMLAKRMKGVEHWGISDDYSLLFDPVASELPILDPSDETLMTDIYKDVYSGWITIGVVRDPVTRLLSLYLHLVRRIRGQSHEISHREWEWIEQTKTKSPQLSEQKEITPNVEQSGGRRNEAVRRLTITDKYDKTMPGDPVRIPTLAEVVKSLVNNIWDAPPAFRPMSSMCGMSESPFDTLIPFETLQDTTRRVMMSLPGDIWSTYGTSGWGPDGNKTFMEYDYGAIGTQNESRTSDAAEIVSDSKSHLPAAPSRARHLFEEESCKWTQYFTNEDILYKVEQVYQADYRLYGWYDIDVWMKRLRSCLQSDYST